MAKDQEAGQQPEEMVAQGSTMTVYGTTVDGIVESAQADIKRLQDEAIAKDGQLAELTKEVEIRDGKLKQAAVELGVARLAAQEAGKSFTGLQRMPNGGIRLMVTLDVDEATPLLSWADGAGEDPATYIAKQIKDALVAVTSS